ncbi:MAG: CoA ester lyase [Pseudomonadota bacterium]|nr:CoA ester lyase [Pseudomonadota bacterium]
MSLINQPKPLTRLNRCQLFGPGSRPEIFSKMAASKADVINLDLEDSVSPNDKINARKNIVKAISKTDWGNKILSVRINALDTPFWYEDVIDLLSMESSRLDCIMIPKIGCKSDVYAVDALVTAVEARVKRGRRISFEGIIETAAGLNNLREICKSSSRLVSLSLGAADFAASMGMQTTGIGGTQENYFMVEPKTAKKNRSKYFVDPWHSVTVSIVAACREHGLLPVDGPFGDFSDPDGYTAQAERSAALGMVGKWAIHPKQVELANKVFSPSELQILEAREILKIMKEAENLGQGATTYKGRLIDIASIKQAQVIVNQAEKIKDS